MFKLFQVMKEEGEDAVRRTIWIMCAASLFVIAVAFAAAAISVALSQSLPLWAALLISAGGVVLIGLICLSVADRDHGVTPPAQAATPSPLNFLSSGIIDQATQTMLLERVKKKPASVLAIAAAAGLAVAALEAFEDR